MFCRIVNRTGELNRRDDALRTRGHFTTKFLLNDKTRPFKAQITTKTDVSEGAERYCGQPHIKAYQPVHRHPL